MNTLEGKRVVVTGASWGIGRAISIFLARKGCKVVATARRIDMLDETVKAIRKSGGEGYAVKADMLNPAEIDKLVQFVESKLGGLDFLVNVAFGSLEDTLENSDDGDLTDFIQVSVTGTMLVVKKFIPQFPDGIGHIVNIVADWGLPMHNILTDAITPYISAKHAISGFTHTLRRELGVCGRPNLKVTGIYPGATASIDAVAETSLDIDDPVEKSGDLISLRDVAESVAFVLGAEHSTITHLVMAPPDNMYNGLVE